MALVNHLSQLLPANHQFIHKCKSILITSANKFELAPFVPYPAKITEHYHNDINLTTNHL